MPEITKIDASRPNSKPAYIWLALFALAISVYFLRLGIPFVGPDEARYAQVAREMLDRGDWITPTLAGHHWFEKPALLYWIEIVSFQIFGVDEFAARFGPTAFGLGTIVSLSLLGRSLAGNEEQRSTLSFANILTLVAATTLGILVFSRGASFDIIITFPLTAALVSFFIFDQAERGGGKPRYLPLIFFYFFIGVALLAKGLIGIVFPLGTVGLFYLLSRRMPSRTFIVSLVWGTLIACAVASIWYWPMYQRYGSQFIDEFFIQHHFQRFTSNKYQHPQPFFFFVWVLPLMTLPWLPFFVAALWKFVRRFLSSGDATMATRAGHSKDLVLFSIAWLVVPLVFFSLSGSKLPGYILPSVPGAIIITSVYLFDRVSTSIKWRNAVLIIAGVTVVGAIFILSFVVPGFAERDSVKPLILAADERGYSSNRVLTLHNISHNAEFYAGSRLVRDAAGKQRYLSDTSDVVKQIKEAGGSPVLVLLPIQYVGQLTAASELSVEVIKDNGELAIAAASLK